MDRERVAVLRRPLVHVDDFPHAHPVLLQEQGRDEADRAGTDDEDLRIGVTEHRPFSSRRRYSMFASCATIASIDAFAHVNIGVSRCV